MTTLCLPAWCQALVHWLCSTSFVTLHTASCCLYSGLPWDYLQSQGKQTYVLKVDDQAGHATGATVPTDPPDNFCWSNKWTVLECGGTPYCIINLSYYYQKYTLSKVAVNFLENFCNGQLIHVPCKVCPK